VRPGNSRLDCGKLARVFGLRLPPWQAALGACLDQLISTPQRVSP
jgi:dTDP-4-dehydrorhamnose reductase